MDLRASAMGKISNVVLRPKGQVTIPREICERFGMKPGDVLEIRVEEGAIVAVPRKAQARVALAEIREAFRRAGMNDDDLLATGRQVREEVHQEGFRARA
jgi:AbrB family looped-hinge helix DNA binding protein